MTTKEHLLTAWRDAVRAVEIAERLATAAADAAIAADMRAEVSQELADLAERAAESAARAAARARAVANEAAAAAQRMRESGEISTGTLSDARAVESTRARHTTTITPTRTASLSAWGSGWLQAEHADCAFRGLRCDTAQV